jgi:hypothetical protein
MCKKLDLSISPNWENLESLRENTGKFLNDNSFEKHIVDSLVMTTSELAENAIKYGELEQNKGKIFISIDIYTNEVIIEVKNKIRNYDDEELKKLDETIQWIRGFQNQYQAYMEKLKYISAKNLKDGESGLGLVRIAYEGQCILDFYVNEDDILAMSAVYKL